MAKDHFIRARVSEKEKELILRKARNAYMTESEFVRTAALGKDVTVIEGADALLSELRRQGNNLNQLLSWPVRDKSLWWIWSHSWRYMSAHGKR